MFRPRPDAPAATIAVEVEGQAVTVPPGASAAAALLLAGLATIRETPVSGSGRAPYCMMGICLDCLAGQPLATALRASGAQYRKATTVWHIDPDGALSLAGDGASETVAARRILLATGAIERPVPIPGWTLPGVMTVGAAQILLKTADLVPDGRAVLAGQGALLYLAALQLARAGAPPLALLETTPHENYHAGVRHRGGLWAGRRVLGKGLGLMLGVRRA